MATSEQLIPIPGRLHSLAPEGHVAGADEIYDDDLQKSQSEVNALVREMGASGENHSAGLVPDPGTTQGNTKYLREDGTWATPAGQDYTEGNGISISSNAISVKAGSNLSFDASGNLNAADTTYPEATPSVSGLMSSSDKTKLDGIQAGAQVHIAPTSNEVKTALGTTSGTTKFLREDGTWQEPAGQNYSAGDGIDISNNEISADNTIARKTDLAPAKLGSGIGTCSTSSGTALVVSLTGYELVTNGFVAVTFANDVPTGATLNVNGKGAKPIIYKGDAIEADTIKADDTVMFCYNGSQYVVTSLGGGGGTIVWPEFVTISLTSTESDDDQNLIGATILITNNDTSATILSTTWQGEEITAQVNEGVNYSVAVGSVSGYIVDSPKTFVAQPLNNRSISFLYMGSVVDLGLPSGLLWCTKNIGANTISDRGLYFGWGKTTGYAYNSGHNFVNESTGPTGNLSFSQDAAYANSNGKYRMPSQIECRELVENTDKERVTIGGISGIKFMKKSNHNIYIFLPGAAWYYESAYGTVGTLSYWTCTFERGNFWGEVGTLNLSYGNGNKDNGYTVRGVKI